MVPINTVRDSGIGREGRACLTAAVGWPFRIERAVSPTIFLILFLCEAGMSFLGMNSYMKPLHGSCSHSTSSTIIAKLFSYSVLQRSERLAETSLPDSELGGAGRVKSYARVTEAANKRCRVYKKPATKALSGPYRPHAARGTSCTWR